MDQRWRLDELVRLAEQALSAAPYDGQRSGRVRDVPDARTIRYYTTLGILDRPLEMRGRTAYYGRRHLLQIVALKRLQARGLPLVEIQKNLAGADDSSLRRWAALPAGFWDKATLQQRESTAPASPDELLKCLPPSPAPKSPATESPATEERARFWAAEPVLPDREHPVDPAVKLTARPAVVLSLAPGVSLVIEGRLPEQVGAEALSSVRPAIEGLLSALAAAGITAEDDEEDRQTTTKRGADHVP